MVIRTVVAADADMEDVVVPIQDADNSVSIVDLTVLVAILAQLATIHV